MGIETERLESTKQTSTFVEAPREMASASDLIRDASLAWDIHRSGWGEHISTNQEFQEFGNDIRNLAQNINHISSVIENAKAAWHYESQRLFQPGRPVQQRNWDLSTLNQITGNCQATLLDCKKLLEENYEFRNNRNLSYNTEWNVSIQPKVDQLRKRLDSHNLKIRILLKPLELHLLSDVYRDLADGLDATQRNALHLQGLLISNVGQAMSEQGRPPPIPLRVPVDIERKFKLAAEKVHPESRILGRFPLEEGASAFVAHFQASTKAFVAGNFLNERTPLQRQYLALLKCVWIIRLISECDVLTIAPRDSQWPGYINQLNEDLSVECQRFIAPSAQRLIAPDLSTIWQDEEFEIWPVQNIAAFISPRSEVCLEEVLKIPMPSQSPSIQRQISVYRLESNSKYRLIESVEDHKSGPTRREEFKLDIDLKSLNLTPIYATPTSRPKALELLLTSSTTQINPTFQDMKHVLRLQHLLTGYKVFERYDQPMVTVSFLLSNHSSPVVEHGRLQLWLPHPFSSSSTSNSNPVTPGTNTPQSPVSPSSFNSAMGSLNLGGSVQSGSSVNMSEDSTRDDITIGPSRPGPASSRLSIRSLSTRIRNRTPSIMTNSSSTSRSTVTSTTTISTGNGSKAHLHMKPAKPMLVIFLKSQDSSAKLATVAIQIDDTTEVKRERCQCRSSSSKCRISCIERSGGDGHLLVQRWDANQGLGSWNLARLGVEQRKELPANAWNDVKRVSMKFEKFEDRYQFSGSPCSCKPTMQHDLARCILDGHHGTFGVVKQIGSQRLKNYHQDRDDTSKKTMVLGSLAEEGAMNGREYGGGSVEGMGFRS